MPLVQISPPPDLDTLAQTLRARVGGGTAALCVGETVAFDQSAAG